MFSIYARDANVAETSGLLRERQAPDIILRTQDTNLVDKIHNPFERLIFHVQKFKP